MFDRIQRILGFRLGLNRVAACVGIRAFPVISLGTFKQRLRRVKVLGSELICACFLCSRDCLPCVEHLLIGCIRAAASDTQHQQDQQAASDPGRA